MDMARELRAAARRIAASILLAFLSTTALAEATDPERSLSPYFFVHGDGATEQLPLKGTDVEITIAGVIADVKVTQKYRNDGKTPIEAEYVFPGSTRAAVHALTMTIGERRVVAEIREKQQARAEYNAAKAAGKSAALLEQHRPNVFKMNVANILPGDEVVVELRYTELIVPTDSVYEFVFPTVVGPRYVSRAENAAAPAARENWQANPYLHQGQDPVGDFRLHAFINSGIPIKDSASPSHRVRVNYRDAHRAEVELLGGPGNGPNKDFILRYQLAGAGIESGLMLYEDGAEKYFLAMIEPPRRTTPAQITARDYVFIVDVSGSMNGFPLQVTKSLMRNLIENLHPTDTFNVLLFAGDSAVLAPAPLPATPENLQRAIAFIDNQQGGGGTELLSALNRALALPGGEDRARSIVIATDGYVGVEAQTFDLIRANLGNANVFAFGIGTSVNRFLIEGMARVGQGEPFIVTSEAEAGSRAEELRRYIQSPVLTKARLVLQGFQVHEVEPPGIPDVLAARPVVVFGKWHGSRKGELILEGLGGEGKFQKAFDVARIPASRDNSALRYLWARSRIARLDDYQHLNSDPERVKEITRLGLEYHLLTNYTSFIAVDKVVRNTRPEDSKTVRQPLPLPEGVSDRAVGETENPYGLKSLWANNAVPTSPEPEFFALIGVAGAVVAWARRRKAKKSEG
jgi:Ca-activated chloride channel family protein